MNLKNLAAKALLLTIATLAGCVTPQPPAARPCPGKSTADESRSALASHIQNAVAFKATGQCLLQYSLEGKPRKENFPVKLWADPPAEMYLQGDVAFDAAGLVAAANTDEFWFWLKPKEVSSYWYGRWDEAGDPCQPAVNPQIVRESLGLVGATNGNWALSGNASFDILTLHNEQARPVKRIYISKCEYLVSKIEYLDAAGKTAAVAELTDYQQVAENFSIPGTISISVGDKNGNLSSAKVTLDSVKTTELSEKQHQRLFVRPQPHGFDHVYQIIAGDAVEISPK